MRTSILIWSMLSSWLMAVVYDKIETMTGMEVDTLLVAAVITMVAGLYLGLYTNNKESSKEEA